MTTEGMFILPSRSRPDKLKRFIDAYVATEATAPVYCYFDDDDPKILEYFNEEPPPRWKRTVWWHKRPTLWEIYEDHFKNFPDASYYGFLGDDLLPQTKNWDQILIAEARNDGVSYGDDLLQGRRLCTHPVVAGDLARRLGWLVYPGLNADTAWYIAADYLKVLRYRPDVILEHLHWINHKAEFDITYDVDPAAMKADPYAIQKLVRSLDAV